MIEGVTVPIAETFHSLQGEGQWVGTPMHFIRLAGCNVGKPHTVAKIGSVLPIIHDEVPAKVCATYDGRTFWCDTDYDKHGEETVHHLVERTWEKHICLTGGEPVLHEKAFHAIEHWAQIRGILVHVETSGTLQPKHGFPEYWWITCAPKIGALKDVINRSDELKLLVDGKFHPDDLSNEMRTHKNVFLCPVNDIHENDATNIERVQMWLRKYPHWRMSTQMHKYWKVR